MQRTSATASTLVALAALVLAGAAIASPALAGGDHTAPGGGQLAAVDASSSAQPAQPSITVHGTGTVTLVPDLATVVLGVDVRAVSARAAQADASSRMNAVIAAVKQHNVAPADMATVNVSLGPVYNYSGNSQKLVGYEAAQSLSVKVRNLSDTGSLIDDAVAAGATQVQGVSLSVADPDVATTQARTAAVADAKARAQALAAAANVTLGAPISITETSAPQPTPLAMAAPAMGAMASTPIVPGSFEVTVEVEITYAID